MKLLVKNNITLFSNKLIILNSSRFYRSFAEELQRTLNSHILFT